MLDKLNEPPYCEDCKTKEVCNAQQACLLEHGDVGRQVKPHRSGGGKVVAPFPLPLPNGELPQHEAAGPSNAENNLPAGFAAKLAASQQEPTEDMRRAAYTMANAGPQAETPSVSDGQVGATYSAPSLPPAGPAPSTDGLNTKAATNGSNGGKMAIDPAKASERLEGGAERQVGSIPTPSATSETPRSVARYDEDGNETPDGLLVFHEDYTELERALTDERHRANLLEVQLSKQEDGEMAVRAATVPSEDVILRLVYEYFKDDAARKCLLRTVWKDSIDIDEPNYPLKQFCSALIRASSDRTGADHG